ncbi:predicted protein [Nematostella vectensis]|uniref:SWIM-type domain-containing protein n=1 Tax=Nematostella vectensis TaxID=45351 RepID=A7T018_NEMVE|nr:predicted protein [Nematostella vectensis]|eukprot:XP_001622794.1 hypothetical protein NEMVEDRAFT_v1g220217 [Nematostella vectensis]
MRYFIKLPDAEDHENHVMGEAVRIRETVDDRIVKKMEKLSGQGVRKCEEMNRHLESFVINDLFKGRRQPAKTMRRFYPTNKDIANAILREKTRQCHSKADQENLEHLVRKWKEKSPDDFFHYRRFQEDTSKEGTAQNILFVFQSKDQQRLLRRYGNQMCLIDATYRTTRYALPLFFLCVRINVSYQVVAAFVTQNEDAPSIAEALRIVQQWNPDCHPKYFMVDFDTAEMAILEEVFSEGVVLLCDFHREKAWGEWTSKNDNGSYIWKSNEKLRRWFDNVWLPEKERWCVAYRKEDFIIAVNTNNGLERQNEALKYQYLGGYRNCSFSEMLTVVITRFLTDSYTKYITRNVRGSYGYRVYNDAILNFLRNRPSSVVDHVHQRLGTASDESAILKIEECVGQHGTFVVKSGSSVDKSYTIKFGTETTFPTFDCDDWRRNRLPCKHICAVFLSKSEWGWERLSPLCTQNPLLSLDELCISSSPPSADCKNTERVTLYRARVPRQKTLISEKRKCRLVLMPSPPEGETRRQCSWQSVG